MEYYANTTLILDINLLFFCCRLKTVWKEYVEKIFVCKCDMNERKSYKKSTFKNVNEKLS